MAHSRREKELYRGSYLSDRKRIMALWSKRNFFDAKNTDMFGITVSNKNHITAHHIFVKPGKCVGLAPLSNFVHSYLDDYLRNNNLEEYLRWNMYLKNVYDFVEKKNVFITKEELIKERDALLLNILNDKSNKNAACYLRLIPYIKEWAQNNTINLGKLKNPIYSKIFNKKYISVNDFKYITDLCSDKYYPIYHPLENIDYKIDEISIKQSLEKYICNKIDAMQNIYSDFNNYPSNYEVFLSKVNQDINYTYTDKTLDIMNKSIRDWMGEKISEPYLFAEREYFLTDNSMHILEYLKNNNFELYALWIKLFSIFETEPYNKKNFSYRNRLRNRTMQSIDNDIESQNYKDIFNKVLQKIGHIQSETNIDEYKDLRRIEFTKEYNRRYICQKLNEKSVPKNEPEIKVNNIDKYLYDNRFLNNDAMGLKADLINNTFNLFLSDLGWFIYNFLKDNNKTLYKKWIDLFNIMNNKNDDININICKTDILLYVHNVLNNLRKETCVYFRNLAHIQPKMSNKNKCIFYSRQFRKKDIRIYIKSIDDIYDSKEIDKLTKENTSYSNFLNQNYQRYLKSLSENEVKFKINKSKNYDKFYSKNIKTDWLGFNIDLLNDNIRMYNPKLFLTEDSYLILNLIKRINKDMYYEWLELFEKNNLEDPDDKPLGYDREFERLIIQTYYILKSKDNQSNDTEKNLIRKLKVRVYGN